MISGRLLTSREIYSKGLIAGLSYSEMRHMAQGFILDMYVWRTKYDAQLAAPGMIGKAITG